MVTDIINMFAEAFEFCGDIFTDFLTSTGLLPLFLTAFILFCLSSFIAPFIFRLSRGSDKSKPRSSDDSVE